MNPTIETYDVIASSYLAKNGDRSWMARHYARFFELLPADSLILDVGGGPGFDAARFRHAGHRAISTDLSQGMMLTGRTEFGGEYVQSDMRQLPFGEAFDALWVCASMLHLSRADADIAIGEFERLLKPNGLLALMVKEGSGDDFVGQAYGHDRGRYFCYWHEADLDEFIGSAFTIVDGWRTISAARPHPWLVRFATKR